ncbi:MAG: glycosyltransferase [archaeon]|nr:glycosyltransferase [archaeon]
MKIYAVIPAYNEEKTVGEVVEKTKDLEIVDEVIVVDDCSTDNTFEEAKKAGAKAVRLMINMGAGLFTEVKEQRRAGNTNSDCVNSLRCA